jgi:hypothetical protein
MKKLLTIGLAAAALAGGALATSGAQAADWNHGRDGGGRYEQGRHDRDDWRWRRGYRHHEECRTVWRYNRYYGRSIRTVVCY